MYFVVPHCYSSPVSGESPLLKHHRIPQPQYSRAQHALSPFPMMIMYVSFLAISQMRMQLFVYLSSLSACLATCPGWLAACLPVCVCVCVCV